MSADGSPARRATADASPPGGARRDHAADVIVVGAGLSGLTAAERLASEGVDVTVLEARERPGGRVLSLPLGGARAADLGAQWLGDGQTRMAALCTRFDVATHPTFRRGRHVLVRDGVARESRTPGSPLPPLAAADLCRLLLRIARLSSSATDDERRRLASLGASEWLAANAWSAKARRYAERLLADELCASPERVSVLELSRQIESMGGAFAIAGADRRIVTGGASRFVDALVAALGERVRYVAPVRAIERHPDGVTVRGDAGTWRAARAIVAVPPPCLQAIDLAPPLPSALRSALPGFVRGSVVKSVAVFASPWWRERGLSGTVTDLAGLFPLIVDAGPADGAGPGVLIALSTAVAAERLAAVAPGDRGEAFARALRGAFGAGVPAATDVRSVDWSAERWTRGGYASRPGLGTVDAPAALFAASGRLHFAGTETADVWRSYMEGAVQAGERAAREVLGAGSSGGTPASTGEVARYAEREQPRSRTGRST